MGSGLGLRRDQIAHKHLQPQSALPGWVACSSSACPLDCPDLPRSRTLDGASFTPRSWICSGPGSIKVPLLVFRTSCGFRKSWPLISGIRTLHFSAQDSAATQPLRARRQPSPRRFQPISCCSLPESVEELTLVANIFASQGNFPAWPMPALVRFRSARPLGKWSGSWRSCCVSPSASWRHALCSSGSTVQTLATRVGQLCSATCWQRSRSTRRRFRCCCIIWPARRPGYGSAGPGTVFLGP